MPGLSRAVTGGVPPLRLRSTCGLPRRRCLPFLLANQTALTPSAQPPGKPGLHHFSPSLAFMDEPWRSGLANSTAPPTGPPACDAHRRPRGHSRGVTRTPAGRRRQHRQRGKAHSVRRFSGRIRGETGAPPAQESGLAACTGHRQPQPGARPLRAPGPTAIMGDQAAGACAPPVAPDSWRPPQQLSSGACLVRYARTLKLAIRFQNLTAS